VKLLFVSCLFAIEGGSEIFVRLPQSLVYGSEPTYVSSRRPEEETVSVVFPGFGGPDAHVQHIKDALVRNDQQYRNRHYVDVVDYGQWTGSFLRASFDAQTVGRRVCKELADEQATKGHIKHLHAIGISVGAFAADSCIKSFNEAAALHPEVDAAASSSTTKQLTLLDPFTSKGIFGYGWGGRQFGKGADVVENFFNRDDPVPTTNDPLRVAYNVDVTSSKLRRRFALDSPGDSMHDWPAEYYAMTYRSVIGQDGEPVLPTRAEEPVGAVVVSD
jgi:hypothetical protein